MKKFPKPWYRPSRGVWYVTFDGRQVNLGPDKDRAFETYKQLLSKPRSRTVSAGSLVGIIDAFLEWSHKHRSAETYEWYRYRLQRFAEQYPDLTVGELRPFHVETWADSYEIAVTSRRNYLRSVKRCIKWAKKQGYIDSNPIADLEVPAAEHKEVFISQGEFEELMSFVRSGPLADLMTVTWETGCRPQESLRVEARHVDLPNQRWVFRKSESKTKRIARVVYLTDRAMEITRRLMLAHPEGPLFRNSLGKPWTTDAVNCGFLAVRTRMGRAEMERRGIELSEKEIAVCIRTLSETGRRKGKIVRKTSADLRCEAKQKLLQQKAAEFATRYSLYALRHSWATNALQKGVDPLTVAILMGHKDPSMLSKVYQHLSLNPQHMLEQARKAAG